MKGTLRASDPAHALIREGATIRQSGGQLGALCHTKSTPMIGSLEQSRYRPFEISDVP